MSWSLRGATAVATMMALVAALLIAGCAYDPSMVNPTSTQPTPLTTTIPPLAPDPNYPDPGEQQAMSDHAFVTTLNNAMPWTKEISSGTLVYAALANCVVQVETGSYVKALEDADEQGFEGRDGVTFVQIAADAYCPSMRFISGPPSTPAGPEQAMSDDAFVAALNSRIPWTTEISPEILVMAAQINCAVQLETENYRRALEDAEEQGFEDRDAVTFVQLAADAYCPSMRDLSGFARDFRRPPQGLDPADYSPTLIGETVKEPDGTWSVELEFNEVAGAVSYEHQHRGTVAGHGSRLSHWSSHFIDAPDGRSPGDRVISGVTFRHESRTLTAQHRIRALFDDGTVGTWSNTAYAVNPHS